LVITSIKTKPVVIIELEFNAFVVQLFSANELERKIPFSERRAGKTRARMRMSGLESETLRGRRPGKL
jgi:hypothetical protein